MGDPSGTNNYDFDDRWDIVYTLSFLERRKCKVAALQFPDELLAEAARVVRRLQTGCTEKRLSVEVYLLADTSYNSLGVDEVAAAHVNADAMVHYGRASFSPLSRLPTYFVLGRESLDQMDCATQIADYALAPLNPEGMRVLLVFLDQPLLWAQGSLESLVSSQKEAKGREDSEGLQVIFARIEGREREPASSARLCQGNASPACEAKTTAQDEASNDKATAVEDSGGCRTTVSCSGASPSEEFSTPSGKHEIAGYTWTLPSSISLEECTLLWVGEEGTKAQEQLQMTYSNNEWAMLNPGEGRWQDGVPLEILRSLKKRYYLIEKAKNASIVGILVGTLGSAGYKDAISNVRKLAQAAGKKTYTLLMGKPSPAKLANFPEIEIFIHIADAQGHILDSKEYYAPIITPYEAQIAFSPGTEWGKEYRLDFDSLLPQGPREATSKQQAQPRFSLLDSQYHDTAVGEAEAASGSALAVLPSSDLSRADDRRQLTKADSAAEYLKMKRSFQGLEAPIVGAPLKEAELARTGRSGRAAVYEQEVRRS